MLSGITLTLTLHKVKVAHCTTSAMETSLPQPTLDVKYALKSDVKRRKSAARYTR
jgi:hypothetical protein